MKKRLAIAALLVGALLLAAAGNGSAKRGPAGPATLMAKGWECFADEELGIWAHCWPPGTDLFSFPPSALNHNFATFDLSEDAEFRGTEILIRADLFHGQPCPQGTHGGEYEFVPDIGYYSCHHFKSVPFP